MISVEYNSVINDKNRVHELIYQSINSHLTTKKEILKDAIFIDQWLIDKNIYLLNINNSIQGIIIFHNNKANRLNKLRFNKYLFGNIIYSILRLLTDFSDPSPRDNEIYVDLITVDMNHRNKKLGTSFLREFIKVISQKDYKRIILDVSIDNYPAIKLYKKIGFSNIKGINESENTIRMEYNINNG